MCLSATSARSTFSGGGDRNLVATSTRETFAMTRFVGTTNPATPPFSPAARYFTMAGVRSRYALASTSVTPFFRNRSAVASSCACSPGL